MSNTSIVFIVLVVLFTLLVAFLVAGQTAIQHTSRSRAEGLVAQNRRGAKRLLAITADPSPYINSVIFVATLLQVAAIAMFASLVFGAIDVFWKEFSITISVTFVVSYLLWAVIPMTLGKQNSTRIALLMSGPVSFIDALLGPLPELVTALGNALTPGKGYLNGPFASEAELRDLVDMAEQSEVIEAGEREMIHSVFELSDTYCKEVMVPRTDMVYIQSDKNLRQALSLALRSGFSRIPVVGESLDDVVGILYVKDVMRRIFDNPDAEKNETVSSRMRPASFCPDSKPIDDLLREMQKNRTHIMVVVDEFGGTAGLVTIEDILEEIVGEIVDEYDAEPTLAEQISDDIYRISARMPIDEVGKLYGLEVDDDDVETVGGLMAKLLNIVPIVGSVIEWNGLRILAERSTGRRNVIDTCIVSRVDPNNEEGTVV